MESGKKGPQRCQEVKAFQIEIQRDPEQGGIQHPQILETEIRVQVGDNFTVWFNSKEHFTWLVSMLPM
jgi:hypothetical protein